MKNKILVIPLMFFAMQTAPSGYANNAKADCVKQISGRLFSDQIVEVCKNANEYTADCVKQISGRLFNDQIVKVCKNTTKDTADCVKQSSGRLLNDQIVEVCKSKVTARGNNRKIEECIRRYIQGGVSEYNAVRQCDR
jgi:deoxyribose-phosphate aldolase